MASALKRLAARVAKREAFVKEVLAAIEALVQEHGKQTGYRQGSCHTHVTRELRDFGHFSFRCSWGETQFGGNTVEAWYHPDGTDADVMKSRPVLRLEYQVDHDEVQVKDFDPGQGWRRALGNALKAPAKILARQAQAAQRANARERRQAAQRRTAVDLRARAGRLGIAVVTRPQ